MTLTEKIAAGAFSALPSTALTAPVERVKCLLQIQGEEVRVGGWDCIVPPLGGNIVTFYTLLWIRTVSYISAPKW